MTRIPTALFAVFCSFQLWASSQEAIFAGGCFWCLEADFDKLPGVETTTSGYDGGTRKNPSYKQVASGETRYVEVVKVRYDPSKVSYVELLKYFLRHIDPTDKGGGSSVIEERNIEVLFFIRIHNKEKLLKKSSRSCVNILAPLPP